MKKDTFVVVHKEGLVGRDIIPLDKDINPYFVVDIRNDNSIKLHNATLTGGKVITAKELMNFDLLDTSNHKPVNTNAKYKVVKGYHNCRPGMEVTIDNGSEGRMHVYADTGRYLCTMPTDLVGIFLEEDIGSKYLNRAGVMKEDYYMLKKGEFVLTGKNFSDSTIPIMNNRGIEQYELPEDIEDIVKFLD